MARTPSLSPSVQEVTRASAWAQFRLLIMQGFRAELADMERLVSPVLFSVTLLLLFSFAMGEVPPDLKAKVYLAETFLTLLFSLQLSFSRLFEPDRQDHVFDLLRTYPVSHTAWFLAKYVLIFLLGSATLVPTMFFGAFLNHSASAPVFSWSVIAVGFLALAGLASVGVLLSAMTLKANSRQILYPLLYFPLTTPVLLAGVQSSLVILEKGGFTEASRPWMGLLLGFDAIYLTLGILLYPELVDET